jgi:hypothetical protein
VVFSAGGDGGRRSLISILLPRVNGPGRKMLEQSKAEQAASIGGSVDEGSSDFFELMVSIQVSSLTK